jgi:hypothetical protein
VAWAGGSSPVQALRAAAAAARRVALAPRCVHVDTSNIELALTEERTMNTTHRIAAAAFSFVLTLSMLIGVDAQATSKPYALQMAQAAAPAKA